MRKVSFFDIWEVVKCLVRDEVSGRAPTVKRFESEFAKACGASYGSATNSGSSALLLALRSLKLPQGSEIICPAWGYVALPNAIVLAGYKPKFVDVQADTGNIDPTKIVVGDAKAIACIDNYGRLCDYDALRKFGLPIVQDAAEAIGTNIAGDIACFSFWANKTITTGEGGMVVSNNEDCINFVNHYKDACSSHENKYFHDDIGYSLCMSAIQAQLGISQLKRLPNILSAKKEHAKRLAQRYKWFGGSPDHLCWAFASQDKSFVGDRPFFYPYKKLPMYSSYEGEFPVADSLHGSYTLL